MRKPIVTKLFVMVCILGFTGVPVSAQEAADDGINKGNGLTATLDMGVDALNVTAKTFGSPEIRGPYAQNNTEIQYLISNWDFSKDAEASIAYEGNNFGGKFAFQPQVAMGTWTFGARINGWAQFSFLRFTLGNDIETNYADWQGADPGPRVYTGAAFDSYINPDNITNSSGLLLEAFLGPLTIAATAGDFLSRWVPTTRITGDNNNNEYKDRYHTEWRYGARIGYQPSDWGKFNVSYRISQQTTAESYNIQGKGSTEIVPGRADAQMFNHDFALFGSFYLPADVSFTAGYAGTAAVYLSEFYNTARGMVETGYPVVLKNGLNLNARWKTNDRLVLRTDHHLTFWQDKDYDLFQTGRSLWNFNVDRKEIADQYVLVNHVIVWNGIGMDYTITERIVGTVYVRNLFSQYRASGNTPGGNHEYVFQRNQVYLKLGVTYSFNPHASVFVNLELDNMTVSRSRHLNSQSINYFVETVNNVPPVPVATQDNAFTVRVPIGITLIVH